MCFSDVPHKQEFEALDVSDRQALQPGTAVLLMVCCDMADLLQPQFVTLSLIMTEKEFITLEANPTRTPGCQLFRTTRTAV